MRKAGKNFLKGFEFARIDYSPKTQDSELYPSEFKVINLINGYRQRGHLFTKTNPVRVRRKYTPDLSIENFDLTPEDLGKEFQAGNELGLGKAKLKDIISYLEETYCQSVGAEFTYIRNPKILNWLKSKMESTKNSYDFTIDDRKYIFRHLSRAVLFENFIHKKFPGQKRFSLEGAESLIPALDAIIEKGALLGYKGIYYRNAPQGKIECFGKHHEKTFP